MRVGDDCMGSAILDICKKLSMSPNQVYKIVTKFQEDLALNIMLAGFEVDDFTRRVICDD